jgi:sugar diacid utilization regulator
MTETTTPPTQQALSIRVGHLIGIAKDQMEHELAWYHELSSSEKTTLDDIIQAALEDFLTWSAEFMAITDEAGPEDAVTVERKVSTDHIFFIAPLEFTQSINLQQTLQVTRLVVDVLENNISLLAASGQEAKVRHALLYYSREVAFSAASVYASAAEAQGAWDARLETLVIESLISKVPDEHLHSRLAALGWKLDNPSFCLVGRLADSGEISHGFMQDKLRNRLHQMGADCCMSVHDRAMVTLVGVKGDVDAKGMISNLADLFDEDSNICVGPLRKGLDGVAATVRAAVHGFEAASALPGLARLFRSDDVLPERALLGDDDARTDLYQRIYLTLKNQASGAMIETVDAYLETGSLEATAKLLGVHGNTVRYRLKRTVEATGWDPMNSRDAYVLLTALKIGYVVDARGVG